MIVNSQTCSTPARRLQAAQRQPARNGPGLGHPPCPSLRYLARGRRDREGSGGGPKIIRSGPGCCVRGRCGCSERPGRSGTNGWPAGWLALRVFSPAPAPPDCFLTGRDRFSSSQNHPHYPRRLRTAEVRSRKKAHCFQPGGRGLGRSPQVVAFCRGTWRGLCGGQVVRRNRSTD